jgi:hypothetical protein
MQAIPCWAIIIFRRNELEETKKGDKEQAKKLKCRQDYKRKKSTGGSLKLPAAACGDLRSSGQSVYPDRSLTQQHSVVNAFAAGFIRMYPHTL